MVYMEERLDSKDIMPKHVTEICKRSNSTNFFFMIFAVFMGLITFAWFPNEGRFVLAPIIFSTGLGVVYLQRLVSKNLSQHLKSEIDPAALIETLNASRRHYIGMGGGSLLLSVGFGYVLYTIIGYILFWALVMPIPLALGFIALCDLYIAQRLPFTEKDSMREESLVVLLDSIRRTGRGQQFLILGSFAFQILGVAILFGLFYLIASAFRSMGW